MGVAPRLEFSNYGMTRTPISERRPMRPSPLRPSPLRVWALAALSAAVSVSAARTEAQGRIVVDTVRARTLVGNRAGDPAAREIYTYLPPGYDRDRTKRFPVLYLLHGMTSHPSEWFDGSYQGFDLRLAMDSIARAGRAFLVVMPHADNAFGGTFYVNSVAFGRWGDFVGRELVGFIDGRYRTMRDRHHRGLAGQSMGGFGALSLAFSQAGTFAHVYAMSPCCLTLAGDLAPASALWREVGRQPPGLIPTNGPQRLVYTMATAFGTRYVRGASPRFPYVVDSAGSLREARAVLRAWRSHLPVDRLARDPVPLRAMCGIVIEYGTADQVLSVAPGARAFSAGLTKAGVSHTLEAFDGGHTDRTRDRFERHLLPYFARAFATTATRPAC